MRIKIKLRHGKNRVRMLIAFVILALAYYPLADRAIHGLILNQRLSWDISYSFPGEYASSGGNFRNENGNIVVGDIEYENVSWAELKFNVFAIRHLRKQTITDQSLIVEGIPVSKTEPSFVPKFSNALHFESLGDYVEVPVSPSLTVTGNFTIEAWVNFFDVVEEREIVCKYYSYIFRVDPGGKLALYLYFGGGEWGLISSSITLSPRIWYHVAGTYNLDTRTMKLYINGVETDSHTLEDLSSYTIYDGKENLYIGAYCFKESWPPPGQANFHGIIDEIHISNITRTEFDLSKPTMNPSTVALWHFDEGVGNIAHDETADNDGDIYGASWLTTPEGAEPGQMFGSQVQIDLNEHQIFNEMLVFYNDELALYELTPALYKKAISIPFNLSLLKEESLVKVSVDKYTSWNISSIKVLLITHFADVSEPAWQTIPSVSVIAIVALPLSLTVCVIMFDRLRKWIDSI